jgi:hypothetical protein
MPQSTGPSILNWMPLPKPKVRNNSKWARSDPKPQFNLQFPAERPSRPLGGSDRIAHTHTHTHTTSSKSISDAAVETHSPRRGQGGGARGSKGAPRLTNAARGAKDLSPLLSSSAEMDIYRDISFPSTRYQQDSCDTSIIEAGSTLRFGTRFNFTIHKIYNGSFAVDISVVETNQQWQVLIQKCEVI